MSIRQQQSIIADNVLNTVDERSLYFILGNNQVWVTRTQHIDYVDGDVVPMSSPSLKIKISGPSSRYEIHIFESKNGGYSDNYAYKVNDQRNRAIELNTIRSLVDEVWAFYSSTQGQREMLQKTIADANREVSELLDRANMISEWRDKLRDEYEIINEKWKQEIVNAGE